VLLLLALLGCVAVGLYLCKGSKTADRQAHTQQGQTRLSAMIQGAILDKIDQIPHAIYVHQESSTTTTRLESLWLGRNPRQRFEDRPCHDRLLICCGVVAIERITWPRAPNAVTTQQQKSKWCECPAQQAIPKTARPQSPPPP